MSTYGLENDGTHNLVIRVDLTETRRVLKKYFSTILPDSVILDVISQPSNYSVLGEIVGDSISDTYAREALIDALAAHMGLEPWPMAAKSEEYKHAFYKSWIVRVAELGGTVESYNTNQGATICQSD